MDLSQKSKRYIRQAFLKLLETKNFESITVKDITEIAEVSRGTFYFYYDSKYDLAEELENEILNGFVKIMEEIRAGGMQLYYDNIENCNTEYFEQYFHYIKEHFYEFRILFSANYVSGFTLRFSKVICKNRLKTRQQWYGNSKEEPDQFSTFIAYREEILSALYISLFSVWVNRNMDLSEKQMGRMLLELWRPLNALF